MNKKAIGKTALILICLFLTSPSNIFAQRGAAGPPPEIRQEQMKKIEAAKWSFIIYRLSLTEERSNKLLPIYQAYEAELKDAVKPMSFRQYMRNQKNMSDATADSLLNQRQQNAQRILDVREKYKPQFLNVLSSKELLEFQMAERDFLTKIVMKRQMRKANGSN